MRLPRPRARQGMTLMEVVVALFLCIVTFMSLMGLLVSGRHATVQAQNMTLASQLACDVLEQARRQDYTTLVSVPAADVTVSVNRQGQPGSLTFEKSLVVTSALSGSAKQLQATVRWRQDGSWHQVGVQTYVASP